MTDYKQDGRLMTFTSPAGDNTLLIRALRGREAISEPFRFELDLAGFDASLDLKSLLGEAVCVTLRLGDGSYRPIHGLINRISRSGRTNEGLVLFHAELVPWLWFLSLTRDCRIFQNLSTQEILDAVFAEAGYADYELRGLKAGASPRAYCVQYQESTLDFVSRLLEEDGIFYFFEHSEDKHLLVLADAPVQHPPCPGQPQARVHSDPASLSEDAIGALRLSTEVGPGKVAMGDYDFEQAAVDLTVALPGDGQYEVYDYPGGYAEREQGEEQARVRLEAYAARTIRIHGSSNIRALASGHQLELVEFETPDIEPTLVMLEVEHDITQTLGFTSLGANTRYSNRFSALPYSIPFRPPRRTAKPRVPGAQTAKVVGKKGEEIWTDSLGRIKVQFHWDRQGKRDENSSCWVRVATAVAGKAWGSFSLPRIGQEVVIEFLEGDPDRPLVVGSVYNSDMTPPYALPDDQTTSTFKSNRSPGGGGYNELRFEDRKDEELIVLHAGKDLVEEVLNDATTSIKHDEIRLVENERKLTVKKDQTTIIEGKNTHTVTGDTAYTAKDGAVNLTLESGNLTVAASSGGVSVDASKKDIVLKAREITLNASGSVTIKVGSNTITVNSSVIEIKQGSNTIELSASGVKVVGAGNSIELAKGMLTLGGDKISIG